MRMRITLPRSWCEQVFLFPFFQKKEVKMVWFFRKGDFS